VIQAANQIHRITRNLCKAITLAEVLEIIVKQVFRAFQADRGGVSSYDSEAQEIIVLRTVGYPPKIVDKFPKIPIQAKFPLNEAIRIKRPIFMETRKSILSRFPEAVSFSPPGLSPTESLGVIPFVVQDRVIGGISFSYFEPKKFTPALRNFILTVSHQCAQAFERARLYDVEKAIAKENAHLLEEARAALQFRDEFLSIASHELRTPLTSLSLSAQLRSLKLAQKDSAYFTPENLKTITDSDNCQIARLKRLINDMLHVSKLHSSKLICESQETHLSQLVRTTLDGFSVEFGILGYQVTSNIEDGISGKWDSLRIEQVVTNLLTNAVKYGRQNPIHVELNRIAQGGARLTVQDQGYGIPVEDQERIFERFERGRLNSEKNGLGLGLYIVREILKLQAGTIHVESEVGRGSKFVVELRNFSESP